MVILRLQLMVTWTPLKALTLWTLPCTAVVQTTPSLDAPRQCVSPTLPGHVTLPSVLVSLLSQVRFYFVHKYTCRQYNDPTQVRPNSLLCGVDCKLPGPFIFTYCLLISSYNLSISSPSFIILMILVPLLLRMVI